MDFAEFKRPYEAIKQRTVEYSGAQKETLEAADQWADRFADYLMTFLRGDDAQLAGSEAADMFGDYAAWYYNDLAPVQHSLIAANSQRSALLSNRLNFHTLNIAMFMNWWSVLTGDERADPRTHAGATAETQDLIGLLAMPHTLRREHVPVRDYYNDEMELFRATHEGILSEADAAIILLQWAKDKPNMVVLPAPGKFEHGNSRTNTDFVIIDMATRDIIGAQMKSNVRARDLQSYDLDRMFLIDGVMDFANISTRGRVLSKAVPTAGIISAQRVEGLPTRYDKLTRFARAALPDGKHLLRIKLQARDVLKGIKPHTDEAVRIIGARATEALYRQPPATTETRQHAS